MNRPTIPADLRRRAANIRADVAYDTKWGTNFPQRTHDALQRARELENAASALDPRPPEEPR